MTENRVIGRNNDLPWRLPADLKRFKALTMGHPLILGRKTFESIGRPLPGRRMIVLSRNPSYVVENVETVSSLEAALERVSDVDRAFVAGGATVYAQAMQHADELHLTIIHEVIEGDTYFPHFDVRNWTIIESERRSSDARNRYPHTFRSYRRRQ